MKKLIPPLTVDNVPVSRRLKLAYSGIVLAAALTLAAAAHMFLSSFERTVAGATSEGLDRDPGVARPR